MSQQTDRPDEAAAGVLALMVAANGRIDLSEMRALDALQAFERLGIHRQRFLELAGTCLADVGSTLCECSWLRSSDAAYIDALLDRVDDSARRMLVCRLAAAVICADGYVSTDERLVFNHVLARWRVSQSMLTQADVHDTIG